MTGEGGAGRAPEGEGGRRRASEAGGRGRLEEGEGERRSGAWAGGLMGNKEESCEWGRRERSGAGRGDFFSSLLVGPRRTNPIRTSPPG